MKTFARNRYTFGMCLAAALLAACGGNTGAFGVPAVVAPNTLPNHQTFNYTGHRQSFTVPAGVHQIKVVALGAAGGASAVAGGKGGRVYAIIPVTPGTKLFVFVGGADGRFNGGGAGGAGDYCSGYCPPAGSGGGASDVRLGGVALSDRILVAGGGGGAGGGVEGSSSYYGPIWTGGRGGQGGGLLGGSGGGSGGGNGRGAGGGTQSSGGAGGQGGIGGYSYQDGKPGNPGTLAEGGAGGAGFGGRGGAGGGGGYYGGGGGGGGSTNYPYSGTFAGGGGGGGSSYAESTATQVHVWQGWKNATSNGLVVFSWE